MRKLWVGGGAWRSTDIIISPQLQSSEKKGILAELNQVPHFLNIIMYLYTFGFTFTLAHCGWNMRFTSCNNSIGFRVSFHLSISSGTQYRTLQRCFSHPRLVIYFFPIPPTKWKSYNWDMLWVVLLGTNGTKSVAKRKRSFEFSSNPIFFCSTDGGVGAALYRLLPWSDQS